MQPGAEPGLLCLGEAALTSALGSVAPCREHSMIASSMGSVLGTSWRKLIWPRVSQCMEQSLLGDIACQRSLAFNGLLRLGNHVRNARFDEQHVAQLINHLPVEFA